MGEYIGLEWLDVDIRDLYEIAPWRIVCVGGCDPLVYESVFKLRRRRRG